ncbi:trypsin-like serine peptidase [Thermomonospora cellulosilytica]|uniref:V8-like Glu-specific endopeptidase n=1 Tax=Thermomonospora cellulosilytica TaxID=1411118 RepID=A0A7W3MVB3_9ACTN|nr:trypsin-like peptidase domain-containing protein [Thermomonospora cellulosilytica]MBA9002523.1 V8-like Glu-specific endopeptidase [Thermomonospora cellulosilytica]
MAPTPRRRVLVTLSTAALAAPLLVPATAHARTTAAPHPVARAQATSTAVQQQVRAFWTRDRMRSAVPMERLLELTPAQRRKLTRTQAPGQVTPMAFPHGGGTWTGGGQVVRSTGRVFFTYQGRTASCSGSAVVSQNKSTVITAGHCVKMDGAWHTNWVFVPGYDNGNTPYGTWTARQTLATSQWAASENITYDVGAAVLNPLNGQSLTDVVGGRAIAFNQSRTQRMYSFGYPAAAPYDGSKLTYCSGTTSSSLLYGSIGMVCNMTGGSSGGPWFSGFDESTGVGTLNSVNSYRMNLPILNRYMYGPYFGPEAQALYTQAQNA